MQYDHFRAALAARGGGADIWLVYVADGYDSVLDGRSHLELRRAFWTQGEAYSFAYGGHERRHWRNFYIFRLLADADWAGTRRPCQAQFETVFGRERQLGRVEVLAATLAKALDM